MFIIIIILIVKRFFWPISLLTMFRLIRSISQGNCGVINLSWYLIHMSGNDYYIRASIREADKTVVGDELLETGRNKS